MTLTPEERQKIYEEEKARHEVRKELEAKEKSKVYTTKPQTSMVTKGCAYFLGISILFGIGSAVISTIFPSCSADKPTPTQSTNSTPIDNAKLAEFSKALIGTWATHDGFIKGSRNYGAKTEYIFDGETLVTQSEYFGKMQSDGASSYKLSMLDDKLEIYKITEYDNQGKVSLEEALKLGPGRNKITFWFVGDNGQPMTDAANTQHWKREK
jgi:hypothetical protein